MAPSDHSHPICVHMAGGDMKFNPIPLPERERVRLVTGNPIAAARFFNFMVMLFLKYVLRVDEAGMNGLFRETSAYYGTVEQQGRLTLHLHMVIWIRYSLSPQQIRERLLASDSDFQKKLFQYLEKAHKDKYFMGTQADVFNMRHEVEAQPGFVDLMETLPKAPDLHCGDACPKCMAGKMSEGWWMYFKRIVDMLICKCNIHTCHTNTWADGSVKANANVKGCKDNKWKRCKAHFPRKLYNETNVDSSTGHINLLKKEQWINTFAPIITYLFRCNTDVTSLYSSTAIKAVLIYVMDYITKPGLKTHAYL